MTTSARSAPLHGAGTCNSPGCRLGRPRALGSLDGLEGCLERGHGLGDMLPGLSFLKEFRFERLPDTSGDNT
jgi:hypothetical protein